MANATRSKLIFSSFNIQLTGVEVVSAFVVVSFSSRVIAVSDRSIVLSVTCSFERLMRSALAYKRPSTPFISMPSIKVPVFTFTPSRLIASTSTSFFSRGKACTLTERLFNVRSVSVGAVRTSTPRTVRFSGKERRIRSIPICIPVAFPA